MRDDHDHLHLRRRILQSPTGRIEAKIVSIHPRLKSFLCAYMINGPLVSIAAVIGYSVLLVRANHSIGEIAAINFWSLSINLFCSYCMRGHEEDGPFDWRILTTCIVSLILAGVLFGLAISNQLHGRAHRILPMTSFIEFTVLFGTLPSLGFTVVALISALWHTRFFTRSL